MSHGGGGHGGGGQERWLVTYADMITLLMVFFIILYGMSELDKKKVQNFANVMRSALNLQPGGGNQIVPIGQGDGVSAPMPEVIPPPVIQHNGVLPGKDGQGAGTGKDELKEIGEQLAVDFAKDGRFTVYLGDRGLTLSLVGSAAFDSGRANLKAEFLPLLDAIASKLKGLPNDISIEGFTDSDPINNAEFPSNWYLSTARANEVRDYLEMRGIQDERMIVVGYGETRPLYDNKTPEGKAKNRRVDVVVLRDKPVINLGEQVQPGH